MTGKPSQPKALPLSHLKRGPTGKPTQPPLAPHHLRRGPIGKPTQPRRLASRPNHDFHHLYLEITHMGRMAFSLYLYHRTRSMVPYTRWRLLVSPSRFKQCHLELLCQVKYQIERTLVFCLSVLIVDDASSYGIRSPYSQIQLWCVAR